MLVVKFIISVLIEWTHIHELNELHVRTNRNVFFSIKIVEKCIHWILSQFRKNRKYVAVKVFFCACKRICVQLSLNAMKKCRMKPEKINSFCRILCIFFFDLIRMLCTIYKRVFLTMCERLHQREKNQNIWNCLLKSAVKHRMHEQKTHFVEIQSNKNCLSFSISNLFFFFRKRWKYKRN